LSYPASTEISIKSSKGSIPWKHLETAQDDFIDPKYLPEGAQVTQFHHIRSKDAIAMLKHWTARQAAHEIPLRFKETVKVPRHGKRPSDSADEVQDLVQEQEDVRGDAGGGLDDEGLFSQGPRSTTNNLRKVS
jgi:hypothetical protein